MPKALVLIDTDAFSAKEVFQELKACGEVKECHMVTGDYDIAAEVEGDTFNHLVDIINSRIERMFQVQETLSMIIVESKKNKQENAELVV
jgi:DNA-binding Lrp family transcriptional regulator